MLSHIQNSSQVYTVEYLLQKYYYKENSFAKIVLL